MFYKLTRLFWRVSIAFGMIYFLITPKTSFLFAAEISPLTIEKYAPLIKINREETYFPSSTDYFLANVTEQNGYLTTNDNLRDASSTDIPLLGGQQYLMTQNKIPVYAFVVPKPKVGANITDIIYFTFYPYNRGKNVCVGIYGKLGCLGKYSTFGNHVGDWEFVLVRLYDTEPILIYLSTHSNGRKFSWGDPQIKMAGTHPIVYSAWGSHGLYEKADRFTYYKLPNGDSLNDDTSEDGLAWNTWENIQVIHYNNIGQYSGNIAWMNYAGRWGNNERNCYSVIGQCILESGPMGPAFKSAADPNNEKDEL